MILLRHSIRRQGISLLEVLLAFAVLAILAVLGIGQLRALADRSKQTRCTQHLRQISTLFHSYAGERGGRVKFFLDGTGNLMWYDELRAQGGLDNLAAKRLFGCPSAPSEENMNWRCYGMRLTNLTPPPTPDPGKVERAGGTGYYGFALAAVEEPSRFLLFADSGSLTGPQSFRLASRKLYAGEGIRLRHQERANVLFLDGHIRSMTASELFTFGLHELIDGANRKLLP